MTSQRYNPDNPGAGTSPEWMQAVTEAKEHKESHQRDWESFYSRNLREYPYAWRRPEYRKAFRLMPKDHADRWKVFAAAWTAPHSQRVENWLTYSAWFPFLVILFVLTIVLLFILAVIGEPISLVILLGYLAYGAIRLFIHRFYMAR